MQMLAAPTRATVCAGEPPGFGLGALLTLHRPGPGLARGEGEGTPRNLILVICTLGMVTPLRVKGGNPVKSLRCPNAKPGLDVPLTP